MPRGVLQGFRLGRVTALLKLDGGIRGIVVGDIIRRLIARSCPAGLQTSRGGNSPADASACYAMLQVKGGEQGDPLMPLLFSFGAKHTALSAVASRLEEGERLFAFLDLYVLCDPTRVLDQYAILQQDGGGTQGYRFTKARRRFGTREVLCQPEWNVSTSKHAGLTLTSGNSDIPTEQ